MSCVQFFERCVVDVGSQPSLCGSRLRNRVTVVQYDAVSMFEDCDHSDHCIYSV